MMRREESERHVSPITALLRVVLMHRHQLDRGHSQFFQIRNHRGHTGVGAARALIHAGAWMSGEVAYVELVDDEVVRMPPRPRARGARARKGLAGQKPPGGPA